MLSSKVGSCLSMDSRRVDFVAKSQPEAGVELVLQLHEVKLARLGGDRMHRIDSIEAPA